MVCSPREYKLLKDWTGNLDVTLVGQHALSGMAEMGLHPCTICDAMVQKRTNGEGEWLVRGFLHAALTCAATQSDLAFLVFRKDNARLLQFAKWVRLALSVQRAR